MAGTVDTPTLERPAVLTLRKFPSLRMCLLYALMRRSRTKRTLSDAALTEAERLSNRERGPAAPSDALRRTHEITTTEQDGLTCVSLVHRGARPESTIIYVPGGGYIYAPVAAHWDLMGALAEQNRARVIAPLHSLAPEGNAATTIPAMVALHLRVTRETGVAPAWGGDSAGGGLALAVAMRLRDEGLPPPRHLVLIGPWLDVQLVHPGVAAVLRRDPTAGLAGMRHAGSMWAGDLAADDVAVSPANGAVAGLPPLTVIVGTRDIMLPDARDLVARAQVAGIDAVLLQSPGGVHCYPVTAFLPEARQARQLIATRLGTASDGGHGVAVPFVGQ